VNVRVCEHVPASIIVTVKLIGDSLGPGA